MSSSATRSRSAVPQGSGPRADLPRMAPIFGLKPRKQYLPWSHAEERLAKARNYWIVTADAAGHPHAVPVWGLWVDGALYWGTARDSRKWRNIELNPNIVVHLESGDDPVIVEGTAREADPNSNSELFEKLKRASEQKYGTWMPPQPEHVTIEVRPRKVLAWSEQNMPKTATRWTFD